MTFLERRRALIMAQNKQDDIVLPSDYIKLNYIESTGTQWIDTNYVCTDDYTPYRVKCKFRLTDTDRVQEVFGTNRSDTGVAYVLQLATDINRGKFVFSRLTNTGSGIRFSNLDTELHEFEYIFKEGAYFDKVLIEGSKQSASTSGAFSNRNMGLFARINGKAVDTSHIAKCQIYSFEMHGQDEAHRILIPAQRKSDSVIGMYDIVTNTFFTNSGTGEFIGG